MARRILLLLPRLTAAVFLAALTLVGALTLARPALGERLGFVYADWARPLLGMQVNAPPIEPGARPWLAGEMQAGVDAWVNNHLVQRPAIVRAFNTAQWATFGTSYMASGTLVRGQDGVLFEYSYVGAHCGLRTLTDISALPAFAKRLKAVQDAFEARGQQFVYVVAAVKTPYFADRMPPGLPCSAPLVDMAYKPAMAIYRQAGVRVIDTRAVLEAARRDHGVGLFPVNGVHWNRQGAALAARALVDDLRRRDPAIPTLTWRLTMAPDETGGDRDLSALLNLWRDPPGWPAPVVTPIRANPQAPRTLVSVNDSFFGRMAVILHEAGTFPQMRAYGYFSLEQIQYRPEGIGQMPPQDAAAVRESILAADIVVLEEVESRMGGPFAGQFLEVMEPALGITPKPAP